MNKNQKIRKSSNIELNCIIKKGRGRKTNSMVPIESLVLPLPFFIIKL